MASEIKICKLIIKGYDQFKNIELDFTDSKTGEPLEKICIIGRNGTGKSKLIRVINKFLSDDGAQLVNATFVGKFKVDNNFFYQVRSVKHEGSSMSGVSYYVEDIDKEKDWVTKLFTDNQVMSEKFGKNFYADDFKEQSIHHFQFKEHQNFLLTYCPPEDENNPLVSLNNVPQTTLAQAISSNQYIYHHQVSPSTVIGFWERLMYLINKRSKEQSEFELKNLDKKKGELIEEFDKDNPKILDKIAGVWNKILNKAGLEFDVENAKIPSQLNENLRAYLRLKDSKQGVSYNALSTGIRNFIFKLGHIYSLYFDREVTSGVLLLDEPENSLYPDFLYDLIDIYKQATTDKRGVSNTQIFVATHSPIIAAQFKPEERIILEFDDEGGVISRRGITPEGDDPNDVLKKDFQIRSLLGSEGIKKWERYLDLKDKLKGDPDSENTKAWRKELMKIGQEYNFEG